MTDPVVPDSLVRQVDALEQLVRSMESSPQLTNASIRDGALTVKDDSLRQRVVMGKQADGSFGLAILNTSGQIVTAEALGFGPRGDRVGTQESTSSSSYTDLATVGPDVTVDIGPTGRMIVLVGAHLFPAGDNAEAHMAYEVSGATTRAASDALSVSHLGTFRKEMFMREETGLNEGSHTVRAKYRSGGLGGTSEWADRVLAVWPY